MFSRTLSSANMPSRLAVFRAKRHPMAQRRPGEARDALAADFERPDRAACAPKMSLATSVRPEPSRPGEAHDLAARERQIERLHDCVAVRGPGRAGSARPRAVGRARRAVAQPSSSRPSISGISFSGGSSGDRAAPTQAAIAQHRYPVGDRVNLLEEMGDEDDRDAARLQIANDLEEERGLGGVEAGGRLVQHENARVVLERARDGDELLDRARKRSRAAARRRCRCLSRSSRSRARLRAARQEISPNRRG